MPVKATNSKNATTEADAHAAEQETIDASYDAELKNLSDSKKEYQTNKETSCGKLVDKLSPGLKEQLEREPDYAIKKFTDPVWLLTRIKHHCTTYKGNTYLPATHLHALKGIANVKQGEHESVTDFTERVKSRVFTLWNTIDPNSKPTYHALAKECADNRSATNIEDHFISYKDLKVKLPK